MARMFVFGTLGASVAATLSLAFVPLFLLPFAAASGLIAGSYLALAIDRSPIFSGPFFQQDDIDPILEFIDWKLSRSFVPRSARERIVAYLRSKMQTRM